MERSVYVSVKQSFYRKMIEERRKLVDNVSLLQKLSDDRKTILRDAVELVSPAKSRISTGTSGSGQQTETSDHMLQREALREKRIELFYQEDLRAEELGPLAQEGHLYYSLAEYSKCIFQALERETESDQ